MSAQTSVLETPVRGSARFSFRGASLPLLVLGAGVAGVGLVVAHNPFDGPTIASCPLYATTGLLCPGCGGTRATYALAHGDFGTALTMHPILTLAIPLLVVLWTRWLLSTQGFRFKPWPFPGWAGVAFGFGMVVFGVLRNIEPFALYLGPGAFSP